MQQNNTDFPYAGEDHPAGWLTMRPQSEIRVCLSSALLDGPGTTWQLAQRTGWSIGMTRRALDNMCTAGDAHKPRSVRVPGVKRPVPVYERAPLCAAANTTEHIASLISAWVGQPMEAAM